MSFRLKRSEMEKSNLLITIVIDFSTTLRYARNDKDMDFLDSLISFITAKNCAKNPIF